MKITKGNRKVEDLKEKPSDHSILLDISAKFLTGGVGNKITFGKGKPK